MNTRLARRSQAGAIGLILGSSIAALLFWPPAIRPPIPLLNQPVGEMSEHSAQIEISASQSSAATKLGGQAPAASVAAQVPAVKQDPPLPPRSNSPVVSSAVLNRIKDFDDLKTETDAYLKTRDGDVAVALFQPGKGFRFTIDADRPLPLASVAKVQIMLAYLESVRKQNRPVTADERALLQSMITESDNAAADTLWRNMGGGKTLKRYMDSLGLQALVSSEEWGANQETAREMAALLARLGSGEILDDAGRSLASELLFRTNPEQRWGVSAGVPQTSLLVKDGWFPGEEGWRVNSAGIVAGKDGRMAYILVVFTDAQPSFQYGVDTIEAVSQMANNLMSKSPR